MCVYVREIQSIEDEIERKISRGALLNFFVCCSLSSSPLYSILLLNFSFSCINFLEKKSSNFNNESTKHETSASKKEEKRDKLEDRAGNW